MTENRCIVKRPGKEPVDCTETVLDMQGLLGVSQDAWPGSGTRDAVKALLEERNRLRQRVDDAMPSTLPTGSQELAAVRPAIHEHRLTYGDWTPDEVGGVIVPEIIVIHYTVSQSKPGVVSTFRAKDYLSVHLCIDVDGTITQMVPFNRKAYHAGESEFKGRKSCNAFSVGIELVNPGPLLQIGSRYNDTNGRGWTGPVVKARHKHTGCKYDWWAGYGEKQVDAAARVCRDLVAEYGITHVVGHDDVSPGRKIDPGPAWEWEPFLQSVYPAEFSRA